MDLTQTRSSGRISPAFTLIEVLMSVVIVVTVFGGMILTYSHATKRAQWSGYSQAAQALSVQQIEQARSAMWDGAGTNQVTQFTNLLTGATFAGGTMYTIKGYTWTNLDLPTSGTSFVRATNFVTIRMLYANNRNNPPIYLQMIRVDTVWPFVTGTSNLLYTNTTCTYRAPDNSGVNIAF